jgi:hypothetical protein
MKINTNIINERGNITHGYHYSDDNLKDAMKSFEINCGTALGLAKELRENSDCSIDVTMHLIEGLAGETPEDAILLMSESFYA